MKMAKVVILCLAVLGSAQAAPMPEYTPDPEMVRIIDRAVAQGAHLIQCEAGKCADITLGMQPVEGSAVDGIFVVFPKDPKFALIEQQTQQALARLARRD